MKAQAIVFHAPQSLSVTALDIADLGDPDVEVEVDFTGISTGTERLLWDGTMPPFPGLGYPLVPGYEAVGRVVRRGAAALELDLGAQVFVAELGAKTVLMALAATAYHALSLGGQRDPIIAPDLIVGHGVMGRLLARLVLALGLPAPTVWETQAIRQQGGQGYSVIHPQDDERKNYRAIYDVSGDAGILNALIARLQAGGEVVLAGFYKQDLSFAYAPAFMREAQIRVAAQWKKSDLLAVSDLIHSGKLALDGLLTHTQTPGQARQAYEQAFADPQCLKMTIDWRT
ncbi:MAG: chlorophyll synthesis pathway protein BchC [Betaproteobacteria bacterium]|nr:chlorophyll synthesis pathway protein BchC [Betaproteobacteria bacterium]